MSDDAFDLHQFIESRHRARAALELRRRGIGEAVDEGAIPENMGFRGHRQVERGLAGGAASGSRSE